MSVDAGDAKRVAQHESDEITQQHAVDSVISTGAHICGLICIPAGTVSAHDMRHLIKRQSTSGAHAEGMT